MIGLRIVSAVFISEARRRVTTLSSGTLPGQAYGTFERS